MSNPALMRFIHGKVLAQADAAHRGVLDPDKAMVAISAPALGPGGLYVLVNETKNGLQWASVYKSNAPGMVVHAPHEVRDEVRGDAAFEARACECARLHTLLPAVTRKYKKESPK